jgi:hypothetical protein
MKLTINEAFGENDYENKLYELIFKTNLCYSSLKIKKISLNMPVHFHKEA